MITVSLFSCFCPDCFLPSRFIKNQLKGAIHLPWLLTNWTSCSLINKAIHSISKFGMSLSVFCNAHTCLLVFQKKCTVCDMMLITERFTIILKQRYQESFDKIYILLRLQIRNSSIDMVHKVTRMSSCFVTFRPITCWWSTRWLVNNITLCYLWYMLRTNKMQKPFARQ